MVGPSRRRLAARALAAALACAALLAGCGARDALAPAPGGGPAPTAAAASVAPEATPLTREALAPVAAAGATQPDREAGAPSATPAGALPPPAVSAPPAQAVAAAAKRAPLVCVDPGHQRHANNEQEPEGPGSEVTKAKIAGGTIGAFTKKPEYELTLEVSLKLRDVLRERGYDVLMIRETNDVDISNKERSVLCNKAGAAIAMRIHADGSDLPSVRGITVLYPSAGEVAATSKSLATALLQELIAMTGARSRGVVPRNDLSGFNWSTVPSVLVEMGFMTNKEEDKLMSTDEYQGKLVEAMAKFVQSSFPIQ